MTQQRNDKCACGSGLKYKKCHLIIEINETRAANEAIREQMEAKALAAHLRREELKAHLMRQAVHYRRGMTGVALLTSLALAMPHKRRRAVSDPLLDL